MYILTVPPKLIGIQLQKRLTSQGLPKEPHILRHFVGNLPFVGKNTVRVVCLPTVST